MIQYLAGNLQVKTLELISRKIIGHTQKGFAGANHFLCSYYDKGARKTAHHFCVQSNRRLFIDSGAYSLWTRRKREDGSKKERKDNEIDLGEYIAFCKEIKSKANCPVVFAALDLIPENPTQGELQKACDEGWDNFQTMKQEGISPCLMTFHQFERKEQLKRIMNDSEYFAVSARKSDVNDETKLNWLKFVFRECGYSEGMREPAITKKIHGLGVSSVDWMERFPFFSVDNTGWLPASRAHLRRQPGLQPRYMSLEDWEKRAKRLGIPTWPVRRMLGFGLPGETPDPEANSGVYYLVLLAMWCDVETECRVTELWRSKGVQWEEQNDIAPLWTPKSWYETDEGKQTLLILKDQSKDKERLRGELLAELEALERQNAHWNAKVEKQITDPELAEWLGLSKMVPRK